MYKVDQCFIDQKIYSIPKTFLSTENMKVKNQEHISCTEDSMHLETNMRSVDNMQFTIKIYY